MTEWQLPDTANDHVEQEGCIDGVAATDTANDHVEQEGHTDGVEAHRYGYWLLTM